MKKKLVVVSIVVLLLIGVIANGETIKNKVIDLILSSYSTRTFSEVPVTDIQIEQILKCGIKAPSARNGQPWRFTVVKDMTKVKDVFRNINAGNVVILVSGLESEGMNVDFDCALATENMFIAAQSMRLGARIYTGPVSKINTEMKKILEIPEGYRVVAALRIGNLDTNVDATSSASPRKEMKEVVNYVETADH
jgi:nitroreductase